MRRARRAFFPLDEQLALADKHYSPGLVKEMVWLSGVVNSFAEAEQVLARIGHVFVSDSSIWRRKEVWGERFKAVEEAQRQKANTLGRAEQFRAQALGASQRLGVSMDGVMVFILGEGWKELKVGCSFEIEVSPTWNEASQEDEDLAHAIHNRYVAHLGGPEVFGQQLWAEAQQRGWERAKDKEVVGDGAPWIWNLTQDYFYDAQQVVDWYHASQHLARVATSLHGEGSPAAQKWYQATQMALYQGHAARLAQQWQSMATDYPEETAAVLHQEAAYLETHQRRMQYLEMREEGYVIGSGMVESGGKQFKARFCGPGMRWSRPGIERLIPIRAAIMSDRFDTMWQTAYNSPPN